VDGAICGLDSVGLVRLVRRVPSSVGEDADREAGGDRGPADAGRSGGEDAAAADFSGARAGGAEAPGRRAAGGKAPCELVQLAWRLEDGFARHIHQALEEAARGIDVAGGEGERPSRRTDLDGELIGLLDAQQLVQPPKAAAVAADRFFGIPAQGAASFANRHALEVGQGDHLTLLG
jgi:hypothetical protein